MKLALEKYSEKVLYTFRKNRIYRQKWSKFETKLLIIFNVDSQISKKIFPFVKYCLAYIFSHFVLKQKIIIVATNAVFLRFSLAAEFLFLLSLISSKWAESILYVKGTQPLLTDSFKRARALIPTIVGA